jgi:hypothetical protein
MPPAEKCAHGDPGAPPNVVAGIERPTEARRDALSGKLADLGLPSKLVS